MAPKKSETSESTTAKATAAAAAAASKKTTASKGDSSSMMDKIIEAITNDGDKQGTSRQAIKKCVVPLPGCLDVWTIQD
jgi:hypothetical protein